MDLRDASTSTLTFPSFKFQIALLWHVDIIDKEDYDNDDQRR